LCNFTFFASRFSRECQAARQARHRNRSKLPRTPLCAGRVAPPGFCDCPAPPCRSPRLPTTRSHACDGAMRSKRHRCACSSGTGRRGPWVVSPCSRAQISAGKGGGAAWRFRSPVRSASRQRTISCHTVRSKYEGVTNLRVSVTRASLTVQSSGFSRARLGDAFTCPKKGGHAHLQGSRLSRGAVVCGQRGAVVESPSLREGQDSPRESGTQRVNESTSQRVNESTSQRGNESTSQRGNESTSQRVNESTSQRVNESTSQRVNESTSQRVNQSTNYTPSPYTSMSQGLRSSSTSRS
jgi:uncharacterized Zn-binding protein involved in type VI secretion